ncbi:hypothetical protein BHM03_00054992 [Ensete ventricosum]|nr:hypothetical protein BHM03_00054992 [Ensete ventricosum]
MRRRRLPLLADSHPAKGWPPPAGCRAGHGGRPLWVPDNWPPLQAPPCKQVCSRAAAAPAGYCHRKRRQPPLRAIAPASGVGLPSGLALAAAGRPLPGGLRCGLAVGGRPCMGAGRPSTSLEIVYPCIPYPDGEDEGGQASSSLAVSTRWISIVILLRYDLTTLAQREGGE